MDITEFYFQDEPREHTEFLKSLDDMIANNNIIKTGNYLVNQNFGGGVKAGEIRALERFNGVSRLPRNKEYLIGGDRIDYPIFVDGASLQMFAKNVSEFSRYLSGKNIPYAYVQTPNKLSPIEKDLPMYISNTLNQIATQFIGYLNNKKVNVLDIRKIFIDNNVKFEEQFFKTDTHWKPETAFQISKMLCGLINQLTNIEFDKTFFDMKNYNVKTHRRMFSGWYTNSCKSLLFSDLDDLTIIAPKFKNDFEFRCDNINYFASGKVEESLFYKPAFGWDIQYSRKRYGVYNLVHNEHTIIKNKMPYNDKKILILNDSFSNPVASFLSHHFSELHFIDIRNQLDGTPGKFDKRYIFEVIENLKPNAVIQMYYPFCVVGFPAIFDINPFI